MYQDLARKARDASNPSYALNLMSLPAFTGSTDVNGKVDALQQEAPSNAEIWHVAEQGIAYLHHTSGTSTGLPKPIPQSHRAAVGVLPCLDEGQSKATFTTTPLYHGGVADCFRAWTSGALIWLFPGGEVPITATNILKSLHCARHAEKTEKAATVRYLSSVPYVLQMMAADVEGLEVLKKMEIVGVGGAALPQSVGDDLVQQDVNLVSRFGSAECGFLMSSHRTYAVDKEWQYLRCKTPHISFEPQEDGLAELVIGPLWPHMAKRNREDGSFATADLFQRHASIDCGWRYHSRSDSQLTLATGKKFDPAPLEAAISTSPLLKEALIFGNGEQSPGALLFRSQESEELTSEDLLYSVWPHIEKLNSESQSHTRLSKNMLVIMPKSSPGLEKSSKGTIMRGLGEKKYATEIRNAYEKDLIGTMGAARSGENQIVIANQDVPVAVLKIIKEVIGSQDTISEDVDLFTYGVDSVACMRIRAMLQNRLLPPKCAQLPLNIVYDCGTIKNLSQYLLTIRKGGKYEKEDELLQMNTYVSQHSAFKDEPRQKLTDDLATEAENRYEDEGEVVVLTGATGALGAHILDQLRSSSRVSKIHCLVRAASPTAATERVSKSLLARNKAPLPKTSTTKVHCHSCKLSDPFLGLSSSSAKSNEQTEDLYTTLARRTTIIIHAAWAVNFSMRLSSFLKDHIGGLQHLINFALSSHSAEPPRFIFCSSTASVLGPKTASPIPERISHDPTSASSLGYSRSKWVAEGICEQAHLNSRLHKRVSVLRIGQLCGDTKNGIWNASEAWPIMLSSVRVTNNLPDLREPLDWLPVDIAAEAVIEAACSKHLDAISHEQHHETPVLHILNPNTQTTWTNLLKWLQTQKSCPSFTILPPDQWVKTLTQALDNEKDEEGKRSQHPAKKLLGLWEDAYLPKGKGGGEENEKPSFTMTKTFNAINVLRHVKPVDEALVVKIWSWIQKEML